jgi:SMC interacting uncharacterized protein involved in chromosome segregation
MTMLTSEDWNDLQRAAHDVAALGSRFRAVIALSDHIKKLGAIEAGAREVHERVASLKADEAAVRASLTEMRANEELARSNLSSLQAAIADGQARIQELERKEAALRPIVLAAQDAEHRLKVANKALEQADAHMAALRKQIGG